MCFVVEFQNYVDCGRRKVEAIVWECPIIGLDLWESPAPAHYPGVFDVEISSPPGLTKWPRCLTARVIPEPGHWWSEQRREETLQTSDHSDQVTKWTLSESTLWDTLEAGDIHQDPHEGVRWRVQRTRDGLWSGLGVRRGHCLTLAPEGGTLSSHCPHTRATCI